MSKEPKFTDDNVPEFVDVTLSKPIDINGAKISALRMRQPTVGDHQAANKGPGSEEDKEVRLIANLCDVTPNDVAKLSIRDFKKTREVFFDFIG